jgi:hypothetical protein
VKIFLRDARDFEFARPGFAWAAKGQSVAAETEAMARRLIVEK